jgi:hypothetical protein
MSAHALRWDREAQAAADSAESQPQQYQQRHHHHQQQQQQLPARGMVVACVGEGERALRQTTHSHAPPARSGLASSFGSATTVSPFAAASAGTFAAPFPEGGSGGGGGVAGAAAGGVGYGQGA